MSGDFRPFQPGRVKLPDDPFTYTTTGVAEVYELRLYGQTVAEVDWSDPLDLVPHRSLAMQAIVRGLNEAREL